MKTYQNLKIYLDNSNYLEYLEELKDLINNSTWEIRQDYINNYKKNSFSKDKNILCVETDEYDYNNKKIKGLIWIWDYYGYLEVFNIIPVIDNKLDYDEYNFLLNKFYKKFILALNKKYNAKIVLTAPEKKMINTIGEDALKALEAFSNGANKTTGNTHPFDFQRWAEFIFIIHRNKIDLGVDELINWLEENGWDEEMALKLGLEYEYSLNLLEHYERN